MSTSQLAFLVLLLGACEQTSTGSQKKALRPVVALTPKTQPNAFNAAKRLEMQYRTSLSENSLISLDSLAKTSDGELSEALGEVAVSVYKVDKVNFFKVVYSKRLHFLADVFAMGVSADIAMFQGAERRAHLLAFKYEARSAYKDLDDKTVTMAETTLRKINPALFD